MEFVGGVVALMWAGLTGLLLYFEEDVIQWQFVMGFIAIGLGVGYQLGRKFHPIVAVAFVYYMASSIVRIGFPQFFWPTFAVDTILAFRGLVAQSALFMALMAAAALVIKKPGHLEASLRVLAFIDALVMCWHWCRGEPMYFLLNNPAVDASFVAATIPLFLRRTYYSVALVPLVWACVFSDSSSGILGVGLSFGLYLWAKKDFNPFALLISTFLAICVAMVGYGLQGPKLLISSGRAHVWDLAMRFWWGEGSPIFGQGLGSFHLYGPSLQMREVLQQGLKEANIPGFTWLHNDWLQILFESGVLGLALAVAVFGIAFWRCRKTPAIWASLGTYGALAVIQMPLRHYIFAVLGFYLLVTAMGHSPEKERSYNPCHH